MENEQRPALAHHIRIFPVITQIPMESKSLSINFKTMLSEDHYYFNNQLINIIASDCLKCATSLLKATGRLELQ